MLISLITTFIQVTADELSEDLYINSFFTADLTATDKQRVLIGNANQLLNYKENSASFKNSLIGTQIQYQISNNVKAVVQGKVHANVDNDITGSIDWSYLAYDFGHDLSTRIGKFQTPFLKAMELRNISYSRLWARPLIPSSGAGGFNEFIGIEFLKRISKGSSHWDFQLSLGKPKHDLKDVDSKNIKSISVHYQQNNTSVRGSLLHAEYTVYDTSGELLTNSGEALMASIEVEFSVLDLIFTTGYSVSDADINPNDSAYYLSLAYPLENITPFVYFSYSSQKFDPFLPKEASLSIPLDSIDEKIEPLITPPQEGINPPLSRRTPPNGDDDILSYSAGFRYTINENYAFKVQAKHINSKSNSGKLTNIMNGHGNALTLLLEGVF